MNNIIEENVIPHKDLTSFSDEANILAVMRDIIYTLNEQEDTAEIFKAITNLRQFNKYNSFLFSEIFNSVFNRFIYIYGSGDDPKVSLNSTYLVKEIFSYREDYIQDWIKDLLHITLLKVLCEEDQLIKEQALIALHNLTDKMHFGEVIEILIEYINLDDFSELSFQLLYALIKKFDQGILENLENWDNIFMEMLEMYNSGLTKHKNYSKELFICIYEKIGRERFEEFLKRASINEDNLSYVEIVIGEIYPEEIFNFSQKFASLNSNSKIKSANTRVHV